MADAGMIPAPHGLVMWGLADDIECFIPLDPEDRPRVLPGTEDPWGAAEYFRRVSPASPRSEAILAETARRLGVPDA